MPLGFKQIRLSAKAEAPIYLFSGNTERPTWCTFLYCKEVGQQGLELKPSLLRWDLIERNQAVGQAL